VVQNSHRPRPQVFHEPRGAELRELASMCSHGILELANGLRLSTEVLSQDLSGAWVTIGV
jgi:hypothetical protein